MSDAEPRVRRLQLGGKELEVSDTFVKRFALGAFGTFAVFNAVALPFLLPKLRVFSGAPFLPAEKRAVNSLFDVLLARRGTALAGRKFVDLGSGDGRFVLRAAQAGMIAQGVEINPWLVMSSRRSAAGVGPGEANFTCGNIWKSGEHVRSADVVMVYGRGGDGVMEQFREFLDCHAQPGTAVVSYYFAIPGWGRRLTSEVDGLKLYEVPRTAPEEEG